MTAIILWYRTVITSTVLSAVGSFTSCATRRENVAPTVAAGPADTATTVPSSSFAGVAPVRGAPAPA